MNEVENLELLTIGFDSEEHKVKLRSINNDGIQYHLLIDRNDFKSMAQWFFVDDIKNNKLLAFKMANVLLNLKKD